MELMVCKMSYNINGKMIDLVDYDWKYLALLDATRYDYFKEVYRDVMKERGNLRLAKSDVLSTPEWLKKNFGKKDCSDIIYLNTVIKFDYWLPKNNFFKVVHVWDTCWDDKLGTIHPKSVNEQFLKEYKKHPDKRFILHYMQPHGPHVTIGGQPTETKEQHIVDERYVPKNKKIVRDFVSSYLTEEQSWTIKKWLHIKPGIPIEACYRKHGKKGIIDVYKNEIKLGLYYVVDLMEKVEGKWLITADHGVRLGERGNFGECHVDVKEVREVPWLEVTN